MAGNSVIGALRVDLGLNSAQFTAGLKKAETGLAAFGRTAAAGLQLVAVAATAAGVALGYAVKHAIDHADALNKSAQKAGVTVEALSRLEYAAKLSDVSLEGLTGGLQKLSKSMADAASGKGPVTAFKALGIEVKNADGTLRSSTAVFGDVADRFGRMENGATKTALAIQIFGKSGAELIPLLNAGKQGLADMAQESDRLGITISSKTAAAAEKFNDTLTRIQEIMQGVVNKVMEAALPALQSLADTLASPDFATAAQQMAVNVVSAIDTIVVAFEKAMSAATAFKKALTPDVQTIRDRWNAENGLPPVLHLHPAFTPPGGAFTGGWGSSGIAKTGVAPSGFDFRSVIDPTKPFVPSVFGSGGGGSGNGKNDITDGIKAAGGALDSVQPKADKFASSFESAGSALAKMITGTGDLKDVLLSIGSSLVGSIDFSGLGGVGSLLKGLFGGLVGGFASGVSSAPRGLAWVGENGPELMNFHGGESVTPMGGAQDVNVRVSFAEDTGFRAYVTNTSRQAEGRAVATSRRSMPKWSGERQSYGVSR
jgi:hypothetical protein